MKTPLIIAHRGASELAPENTLAAFRRAAEDGAEGIEFDVRLARDAVPVVFHDPTLRRLAGDRRAVGSLSSGELGKFDVGSWFNRRYAHRANENFAGERIPTLEQVLNLLAGFGGLIYIELKCGTAETEALTGAVCRLVERSGLAPRVIVKSFNLEVIPHARRLCPEARTAALFAPKILSMLQKDKRLVETTCRFGADMISVHFSLATRSLLDKTREKNLPVTVWTTNHPRWVRRAVNLGLFALITNNPARLLAAKNEILSRETPTEK